MTDARVRPTGSLPAEVTSFVGRQDEIIEITRLLYRARLVTLTGRAGIGKSRLALRVAAQLRRAFPHGASLVDLAGVREGLLIGHTVERTLGLPGGVPPDRELLLILDNCEHLVDDCAKYVDHLLCHAGKLRVVATSREALRVAGERTWAVGPLGEPAAAKLFAERASAVQPAFRLTQRNRRAVLDLCRRLRGVPLAIEQAALHRPAPK